MSVQPIRSPEQAKAQAVADTSRVVGIGFAAGSLSTALKYHIAWLDTLARQLRERGMTAQKRHLIIGKEIDRLRDVLADADAWIAKP